MTETLIKIEELHKSFGKNEVLKASTLRLNVEKLWSLLVRQGAGNQLSFVR